MINNQISEILFDDSDNNINANLDNEDNLEYEGFQENSNVIEAQLTTVSSEELSNVNKSNNPLKRRHSHYSFERNPCIRKRQQARLFRKLCQLMDEYTVKIGQQAAIICCTSGMNKEQTFRCYGSQPLENIIKKKRDTIVFKLNGAMSELEPSIKNSCDLFELPPLKINGKATTLIKMTQAQLRFFVPEMLKYSTGKCKPNWGKLEFKPEWWPEDVPWANVRSDQRDYDIKKKVSWTSALRRIVHSCYRHHGRLDLLNCNNDDLNSKNEENCYENADNYFSSEKNNSEINQVNGSLLQMHEILNPDGTIKIVHIEVRQNDDQQNQNFNLQEQLDDNLNIKREVENIEFNETEERECQFFQINDPSNSSPIKMIQLSPNAYQSLLRQIEQQQDN